jgi:protein-disulfide isomerase
MNPSTISEFDHVDGPSDAAVLLIEYADFECPFCVKAYSVIESARNAFRGNLRFVYRHIPKSADTGFTKQAAEASEFAAAAGQFWAMHAQLFLRPDRHDLESLVLAAATIGLDPTACRNALVEGTYAGRVREIAVQSVRSGIIGTPTLFINGARYQDRIEDDLLHSAISLELQAVQAALG